jgi:hypothetical protein
MSDDMFKRGYTKGMRDAISWLHNRALEMNDAHAKAILNSAATHLGWDFKEQREGTRINISPPNPSNETPAQGNAS